MKTEKNILINQELKAEFTKVGQQEDLLDPMVIAKFFNPSGRQTWYAISYDETDNICFGYVTGFDFDELGYFSIDELEALEVPPFGLRIECDFTFTPCPLSKIKGMSS